jgi:hypothetical protein
MGLSHTHAFGRALLVGADELHHHHHEQERVLVERFRAVLPPTVGQVHNSDARLHDVFDGTDGLARDLSTDAV